MTPFRWLVAVGCMYEIAALPDWTPLPTISKTLNNLHRHPIARVAVWLWCGAWAWHFIGESSCDDSSHSSLASPSA